MKIIPIQILKIDKEKVNTNQENDEIKKKESTNQENEGDKKNDDNRILCLDDISFYRDKVVLYSEKFKEIFGKNATEDKIRWKGKVVKIKCNNKSIYRLYKGSSIENVCSNEIGLTYDSLNELNINLRVKRDKDFAICLCKSNRIIFLWRHPD